MSVLTQQERDGLEDVFLSIQTTGEKRYKMAKELSSLIIATHIGGVALKVLKRAKIGLKKRKTLYFFSFFNKKKKSLSK